MFTAQTQRFFNIEKMLSFVICNVLLSTID